ncbi:MAG: GAF domain-containing protein, partial [Candidatus Rokuibacteriota bacterium]
MTGVHYTRRTPVDPLAASLIESADAAVMVTDDRLAVVAWNGAMERLTATPRRNALGRPAVEALKFLGGADVAAHLARALRGESSATGEALYEIPDSRARGWISARYAPWRDAAGAVIGVIGTHVEVTARRRQADRLRELAEVEQLVGESLVLDDVLRRITDAGARLLGAPVVQLWTAEPAARVMRLQASTVEPGAAQVRMPHEISYGEGIAGRVAATKTAIYVDDVARDGRALSSEWARETGIQRMLSVPILSADELLGVLVVRARDASLALEDNRSLVTSLAARAAVAIQNARTYTVALRRAGRLRDLVAISQSISSSLDVKDVMQRITRAAAGLRPGALSTLHLLDAERGVLRAAALTGAEWEGLPAERPSRTGLPGLVVEAHAPVLVTEPSEHPHVMSRDWWGRRPNATYYGVPIDIGETFVGVLDFVAPDGVPDREEQEALRLLAAQAGVAIRNARLYQEAEQRREAAEALARLGRELTGTLDVERMAEHVTRAVCELLSVRGCVIFRHQPEDGTLHAVAASGPEAGMARGLVLQPGEGVAGRAVAERKIVTTPDLLGESTLEFSPAVRRRMAGHGYRAAVGVPLLARDRVVGALSLGDRAGRDFTHEELQALQAFADQAALALESARLYESARESLERLRETQAQLVQAAKMSALGQLVSGVAHELNNPLSVIIGYGQLLLAREIPEALRRPVELMVAQGDRMAKIVRNLLY